MKKVKDIASERKSGVISIYSDDECVSVMAHHKAKIQRFLERDVVSAEFRGGNVYIEIS